jgi:hypothetical protein
MTTKLIFNEKTSINEVSSYFDKLDSGKKVRARSLGDGQIELYVRKNSFKQFFTDKLRPDFLVKRDYITAREHIFKIIDQAAPFEKNSHLLFKIKQSLSNHNHDFCSHDISLGMQHLLHAPAEKKNSETILENHWKAANVDNFSKEMISGSGGQKIISKIIESVKDPEDKKILQRNFNALNAILFSSSPSKNSLTTIDYHHAIDFSRAWLKELPELISKTDSINTSHTEDIPSKTDNNLVSLLTDFSKRITTWSAAGAIDYQGGEVGCSYADLVIIDPQFSPIISRNLSSHDAQNRNKTYESDFSVFTLSSHSNVQTFGAKADTDGLNIVYTGQSAIDEKKIEALYENIGVAIVEKMRDKNASAKSGSIMKYSTADQLYVVHLPVLNPFENESPSEKEKSMMVNAFVRATVAWTEKYPDLRIKVQLPPSIIENDIKLAAMNMGGRMKDRVEYQKKNNT